MQQLRESKQKQNKCVTTPALDQLRNAGLKVWMLTGDKLETATCIAKSSRLVSKTQDIHMFKQVTNRTEAHQELNAFRRKQDAALVIRGLDLEVNPKFQILHEEISRLIKCFMTTV